MMRMKITLMAVLSSVKLRMDLFVTDKSVRYQIVKSIVATKFMILNLRNVMIQMGLMMMDAQTSANLILFTPVKIMIRNFQFANTTVSLVINLEVTTGHV